MNETSVWNILARGIYVNYILYNRITYPMTLYYFILYEIILHPILCFSSLAWSCLVWSGLVWPCMCCLRSGSLHKTCRDAIVKLAIHAIDHITCHLCGIISCECATIHPILVDHVKFIELRAAMSCQEATEDLMWQALVQLAKEDLEWVCLSATNPSHDGKTKGYYDTLSKTGLQTDKGINAWV